MSRAIKTLRWQEMKKNLLLKVSHEFLDFRERDSTILDDIVIRFMLVPFLKIAKSTQNFHFEEDLQQIHVINRNFCIYFKVNFSLNNHTLIELSDRFRPFGLFRGITQFLNGQVINPGRRNNEN